MALQMESPPRQTPFDALAEARYAQVLAQPAPVWLQQFRQNAFGQFRRQGLPTRSIEAWRFIDLQAALQSTGDVSAAVDVVPGSVSLPEAVRYPETAGSRVVFVDGRFAPDLSHLADLPANVIVADWQTALAQHGERLQAAFSRIDMENRDAFSLLNDALATEGLLVDLPAGVALSAPIQILHLSTQTSGIRFPRVLLNAERGAKAVILQQFMALSDQVSGLALPVAEAALAPDAHVTWVHVQDESHVTSQLAATRATVAAGAVLDVFSISLGGKVSRHGLETRLTGETAHCNLRGLSVLSGESQVFDSTVIDHAEARCTSEQLYKGILDDRSRSEFDGTIVIRQGAQQTDAAQLNRNLLLSEDARVMTRPQLRIDADDVKCAHGATVGQLDDDQLFYLASRGIGRDEARQILTFGFAEEVIETIPVAALRNHLARRIRQNLQTTAAALQG